MVVPLAPRPRSLQYSYQYQSSSCSGAAASAVRSVDVAIRLAALIGLIGACLVLSGTVWMAAASAAAGGVEGVLNFLSFQHSDNGTTPEEKLALYTPGRLKGDLQEAKMELSFLGQGNSLSDSRLYEEWGY